jgi:hypothetical protein
VRIVLVVLLLSGCAHQSREEYAAQLVAKASPYCEALGYQPRTEPWRQCVLKVMNTMAVQNRPQRQPQCQRFLNGDIACY